MDYFEIINKYLLRLDSYARKRSDILLYLICIYGIDDYFSSINEHY